MRREMSTLVLLASTACGSPRASAPPPQETTNSCNAVDESSLVLVRTRELTSTVGKTGNFSELLQSAKQLVSASKLSSSCRASQKAQEHQWVDRTLRDSAQALHQLGQDGQTGAQQPAVELYDLLLAHLGRVAAAHDIAFLRAELLFYRLDRAEAAADGYLDVVRLNSKSAHAVDSLTKAMSAIAMVRRAKCRETIGRRCSGDDPRIAEVLAWADKLHLVGEDRLELWFAVCTDYVERLQLDEAQVVFSKLVRHYRANPRLKKMSQIWIERLQHFKRDAAAARWGAQLEGL